MLGDLQICRSLGKPALYQSGKRGADTVDESERKVRSLLLWRCDYQGLTRGYRSSDELASEELATGGLLS